MSKYTIHTTYLLEPDSGSTNLYGYTKAIHCNYNHILEVEDIDNQEFNIYFTDPNDFKFLSVSGGTGYTANRIKVMVQLVNNDNDEVLKSDKWKVFDVTDQISGYTAGMSLKPTDLTSGVFKIPLRLYNLANDYDLSYLNYPPAPSSNNINLVDDPLCFGDEVYFIGNVTTSVEAKVYSTDLPIILPLNQYNSTTNETWNGASTVYISEIGLYDKDYNLVAIAKLNNPIPKDDTISRTFVFGIDF